MPDLSPHLPRLPRPFQGFPAPVPLRPNLPPWVDPGPNGPFPVPPGVQDLMDDLIGNLESHSSRRVDVTQVAPGLTWQTGVCATFFSDAWPQVQPLPLVTGYPSPEELAVTSRPERRQMMEFALGVLLRQADVALRSQAQAHAAHSVAALAGQVIQHLADLQRDVPLWAPITPDDAGRIIGNWPRPGVGNPPPLLHRHFRKPWQDAVAAWSAIDSILVGLDFILGSERTDDAEARFRSGLYSGHHAVSKRCTGELPLGQIAVAACILTFLEQFTQDEDLERYTRDLNQLRTSANTFWDRFNAVAVERTTDVTQRGDDLQRYLNAETADLAAEALTLAQTKSELLQADESLSNRSSAAEAEKQRLNALAATLDQRHQTLSDRQAAATASADQLDRLQAQLDQALADMDVPFRCPYGHSGYGDCNHLQVQLEHGRLVFERSARLSTELRNFAAQSSAQITEEKALHEQEQQWSEDREKWALDIEQIEQTLLDLSEERTRLTIRWKAWHDLFAVNSAETAANQEDTASWQSVRERLNSRPS